MEVTTEQKDYYDMNFSLVINGSPTTVIKPSELPESVKSNDYICPEEPKRSIIAILFILFF